MSVRSCRALMGHCVQPGLVAHHRLNMNAIFAVAPESVVAARNATTSIPIVALDLAILVLPGGLGWVTHSPP
jgi:hypothetical protein